MSNRSSCGVINFIRGHLKIAVMKVKVMLTENVISTGHAMNKSERSLRNVCSVLKYCDQAMAVPQESMLILDYNKLLSVVVAILET